MSTAIIVNTKQEGQIEQILRELKYALQKTYSEEDLLELFIQIMSISGKETWNTKKEIASSLKESVVANSKKAYSFTKNKISTYKHSGVKSEFKKDFESAKYHLRNSPEKIVEIGGKIKQGGISFIDGFLLKSKEEKIELISVGLMSVLIFYASAGGTDLEGGIPDTDLNFGIGVHRHWMSHSIIAGFVVEFIMRGGIEIINLSHKNLPEHHHKFWDKTNHYINKHKGKAIGAMWAGIGAHLLKDSGILGHGMKSYVGIPFEMPMEVHQGLFTVNAVAASVISANELKKNKI